MSVWVNKSAKSILYDTFWFITISSAVVTVSGLKILTKSTSNSVNKVSVVVGIKVVDTLEIVDGKETEDVIGREVDSVERVLTGRVVA